MTQKIAIAGAGPAGSSLAIRLAEAGFDVTLIEREKFPRHKLCGEFISPECFDHFRELGVLDRMLSAGGDHISETRFYSPSGKNVAVPSEWFGGGFALSLSRAEMDDRLMRRTREMGVTTLEETSAIGLRAEKGRILAVITRNGEGASEVAADLFIDATGRARVLEKLAEKHLSGAAVKHRSARPRLVGFKNHFRGVSLEKGACEIYFFRGGYGGLSYVEQGAANFCFLIKAGEVKRFNGKPNKMIEELVFKNKRARLCLEDAEPIGDWLAVSIDGFGKKELRPAANLFTVGDSAAFIDPFTGSGMLMALESSRLLAGCVATCASPDEIALNYARAYRQNFRKRLWVCAPLRKWAFMPNLAGAVIAALSLTKKPIQFLARATRPALPAEPDKP
jgi:flavin-dependent dehydrogenase